MWDYTPKMDRRRFLTTAAAALTTGGIAGCMSGTGKKNRNETANRSRSNNTGSTTNSESRFQQQLENVRSATQKYTDPKKALRDGFKVSGPYVPGMGWHFIHTGRLQDAAKNGFDLERPPILTYIDDEGLKLASAVYGAPSDSIPK
ncbi:MAG: hypothetical protein SV760_01250, partial [Halobacteria archaeon]|nr:hypothetical protein [Halobacteria archaeon]